MRPWDADVLVTPNDLAGFLARLERQPNMRRLEQGSGEVTVRVRVQGTNRDDARAAAERAVREAFPQEQLRALAVLHCSEVAG